MADKGDSEYWGDKHKPFVPAWTNDYELAELADAIVRGASVCHAIIPDLRNLIEAVQAHPDARLAEIGPDGKPTIDDPTEMRLQGGEVIECDCSEMTIGVGLFASVRFTGNASFGQATFAGDADFWQATFTGTAYFWEATFTGAADFWEATFTGAADFRQATFTGDADFGQATFTGDADFGQATFTGDADFGQATFTGDADFGSTRFLAQTFGDLRPCFLRTALFAESAAIAQRRDEQTRMRRERLESPLRPATLHSRWVQLKDQFAVKREQLLEGRGRHIVRAVDVAMRKWPRNSAGWLSREFGWQTVRSLGQLQILNRVSLVALIAVPVLAGLTAVFQAQFPHWPALGTSLALAFFAAVFVTLGLFTYQVFACQEVRKHDEDEFIERAHIRYPEHAEDRDDGIRRAIDYLETVARRRPDRHANFVMHHGDTIWIPPRDRIDWFEDWEPPAIAPVSAADEAKEQEEAQSNGERRQWRMGVVPGAERRRIAIEEGAKAEYWLRSRDRVTMAWMSFGFYIIGLVCLIVIIGIQSHAVGKAAGWWGQYSEVVTASVE